MSAYQRQSNQLTSSLGLPVPPVAIGAINTPPPGVEFFDGVAPAGCVFWEKAASRVFATSARDHELCSIGVHTHHLADPSASQPRELEETLKAMYGLDYVRPDEVAAIPVLRDAVKHILYGPLAQFPLKPDVVLLFAHAEQGLVLSEAIERVDSGIPPAMGRPACAVVPQVINQGRAAMSLGCCGARTYLDELTYDVALWALPGGRLNEYCEEIETLARANRTLTAFHQGRRTDVASGKRPSVRESLERLS
ncbi:MAG: DUF169 domain-containing protein [Gammaproteobacteria bacterium]|nr:DUF169 domain-containing protein [Gammaproteobacteria bacterium]